MGIGINIFIGGGGDGGGGGGARDAKLGCSIGAQDGARDAKLGCRPWFGSRRLPLKKVTQRASRRAISSAISSAMRLVLALSKIGRDDQPCEQRHRGHVGMKQLDC